METVVFYFVVGYLKNKLSLPLASLELLILKINSKFINFIVDGK